TPGEAAEDWGGALLPTRANEYHLIVATIDFQRCLPDVYWLNVFGPSYVDLFGRDRLLSVPVGEAREIRSELIALRLSSKPCELVEEPTYMRATREAIKNHLGRDAFCDQLHGPDEEYRTPDFFARPR